MLMPHPVLEMPVAEVILMTEDVEAASLGRFLQFFACNILAYTADPIEFCALQMYSQFIQTFNTLGLICIYHKSIQKFKICY
jgi:hypothetical protein